MVSPKLLVGSIAAFAAVILTESVFAQGSAPAQQASVPGVGDVVVDSAGTGALYVVGGRARVGRQRLL